MKFPSLKTLAESTKNTFRRFPLEVMFALAGTIAATVNIELNNIDRLAESWCVRAMMTGNLGLLLSLSATLSTESRGITGKRKLLLRLLAPSIAVILLLLINPAERQADYVRFFLLSLAFHLLVAYAAFTAKDHMQGFWQFNKTLFLRFLTSALYGGVLFLGLAAAIGAMNFLFNFKFEWDTFSILWIWIVGIFSTVFFLAGVPANLHQLDQDTSYPKGLKVFTQYVLVPLATVYVVILLAYEIKILVHWSLPKGYVSNIILGYAVFGILALLLVYPIREREENKWLKTYARSFYFLLLPLLILLFLAVGTRIFKYGITEQRYFLIVLAVWLLFISIYFLVVKKQNIKLIPISLSILTLFAVYGPQSAFSVAKYSQTQILLSIFQKNGSLKQGKLKPVTKIDSTDGTEAIEKLRYLINNHNLVALQPYLDKDLNTVSNYIAKQKNDFNQGFPINQYELRSRKLQWAANYLGLARYTNQYGVNADTPTRDSYALKALDVIDIRNYDYMVEANGADSITVKFDGLNFTHLSSDGRDFTLVINNEKIKFNTSLLASELLKRKDIDRYYSKNNQNTSEKTYQLPAALLTITKQTKEFKITFAVNGLSFFKSGGKVEAYYTSAVYLIQKTN